MNKEYVLIGLRTSNQRYKVIDRVIAQTLREAEIDFKYRNHFKKILERYNLIICEAKKWMS